MPDDLLDLSDIAEPAAPRRRQPRGLSDPLDTIAQYESGDRNVPNYRFDPGHTAQGHYQITNTNWRNYGPKAGVDTAQYPSAMKAPKDIQRKVASALFNEHGFGDWAPYNPALRKAIQRGEGGGQIAPSLDLSDIAEKPTPAPDLSDIAETAPTPKPLAGGKITAGAGAVQQPRQPSQRKVTSMAELKQADEAHIQATDKLSRDIAWHFGDSVLNQFNDLPEDRQIKIARLASQYAAADEEKKRRGEPIVESYDWKRRNQDMVGVKGDSVTDRGEMMARQQGLTPDKLAAMRDADTAATNPLLQSTGVMRWLKETGAQGTAGLLHAASGVGRIAAAAGAPGAQAGVDTINEKSNQLRGVVAQANEREPMGWGAKKSSDIAAGLIEYAPLLATGHPEGVAASIAAGAGTFGGYSALQGYGETGDPREALKQGALAAPFGALMGVPGRALGTAVDNPLQAALASTAVKGAGYYGIGRAEGMTPEEAAENAAVLSAFAGPEIAGEVFNAVVGRATRGPIEAPSIDTATGRPMEPAVKSAIESAFDVAGVSPELAEKALKTPVIEPPRSVEPTPSRNYRPEGMPARGSVEELQQNIERRNVLLSDDAKLQARATEQGQDPTEYRALLERNNADNQAEIDQMRSTSTPLNSPRGTAPAPSEPVAPVEKSTAVMLDGSRYVRSAEGNWLYNGDASQVVKVPATIAKLDSKLRSQRGSVGEPPEKPKPAPPGVKTGAVEDRPDLTKKAEPIIGIVGNDGTVEGKADPNRSLTHSTTFRKHWTSIDHWHYEPSTETVYWTSGDRNVSAESKHAAENWLDKRGYAVKAHSDYVNYVKTIRQLGDTETERPLHLTSNEQAMLHELDKEYGALAAEHPSASQPRTPETGQFSHADDFGAISKELFNAGKRMQDDYAKLAQHPARRDLSTASDMSVRNYFRQLYNFVNTYSPEKVDLVRQAENAQYANDPVKATVFAERALGNTHDFANEIGNASLATRMLSEGVQLKSTADWGSVLRKVREGKARAEKGFWHGERGAIGEKPEDMKPAPKGVKTGAVADLERDRRLLERSLPKHLEATEREPGTDLIYQELPNKLTKARVEKRIADRGIEATEEWYNKQEAEHPEQGAELTDAFRQLSDHYLTKLATATDPKEIAALTAKAKELAGAEAPRSTGLGQAVQAYAMLDKYTGPEVLLEASRLAERTGKALPDEIVKDIAKTGQEFKTADEQLTEVRKELAKAEREAGAGKGLGPGKGPGKGGTSAKRIEQLRDQQTQLIEKRQQAKIRQEQTLAKLEHPPTKLDYYKRFNNIIRGLMVSAIPTAVRNYETQGVRFGVERLVDLFALAARRADAKDPHISARNIHRDLLRLFQSESRSKAVSIAGEYPKELRRLFATYGGGQVETAQAARTFAGRVEKAFGSVESFVQKVNWLNQLQEFHIRGAEFLSHMDMLVERKHGMTLEQFMREKGADKLSKEMISDSVDHALEVTFADLPAKDTEIGKTMNSLIKLGNLVPPTVSPVPFARWFYNSWKFNYQFSPLGLADLARTPRQVREARRALQRLELRPPAKTEVTIARRQVELEKARANVTRLEENAKIERYRTVAKATIGSTFLLTAYAARSSSIAGEKWYEMRVPGTDQMIDARPFAPFSIYLFLAEGIRRSIHGERPYSKNEFFAGLGSSTSATGGMEVLYDKYRKGDFNSLLRAAQTEGADLGTAILTPVRQIRDLIGEFDKSQATTYDTATQPGLGPIKTSIPYGERLGTPLPKAYKPTSDEPIHATHPITKFLGPRIITPKNFVEKEADRLRFDFNEVRPATGVPQIDQLEEQWMGEYVGKQATKLGNNPNYRRLPDGAKAELYLKPLFAAGRTYARAKLASTHPDLYLKLIERSKSARQRAMENDFGVKPLASPY